MPTPIAAPASTLPRQAARITVSSQTGIHLGKVGRNNEAGV